MKIKLGYYPVLDMLLAIRQMCSYERFKPFVDSIKGIEVKLTEEEKKKIFDLGEKTNEWLKMIEILIGMTNEGYVSPEEIILYLKKQEKDICKNYGIKEKDLYEIIAFLEEMWISYFSIEVSRSRKNLFKKTMSIDEELKKESIIDYILKTTDRVKRIDDNIIRVLIKPEHDIRISQVNTSIVMPSAFASRKLTFWNQDNNYIFYVSLESSFNENMEPTDMMMLKTLAFNDKTRLKILKILTQGSFTVGDVANKLNMNPSTVSRHFKVFKDAGYVDIFSQEGNAIYYSINLEEIKSSLDVIYNYITE